MPAHVTDCPNCGKELGFYVGPPDHTPWICDRAQGGCGRGWWVAELAPDARKAWRSQFQDFAGGADGHGLIPVLQSRCLDERDAARRRGTSVRPDWVSLLDRSQLASILLLVPAARAALLPEAHTLRQAALAAMAALGA